MNTEHLSVYASPRMAAFLRDNAPWSGLVEGGNIDLVEQGFQVGRFGQRWAL
jgi:hypothetical protein